MSDTSIPDNTDPLPRSLNRANRAELTDEPVTVLWSKWPGASPGEFLLPEGCGGHLFVISSVGDVASGRLPRPANACTTMFNGDGYIMRLDMDDRAAPRLSAKLAGVPSLFADRPSALRPITCFM